MDGGRETSDPRSQDDKWAGSWTDGAVLGVGTTMRVEAPAIASSTTTHPRVSMSPGLRRESPIDGRRKQHPDRVADEVTPEEALAEEEATGRCVAEGHDPGRPGELADLDAERDGERRGRELPCPGPRARQRRQPEDHRSPEEVAAVARHHGWERRWKPSGGESQQHGGREQAEGVRCAPDGHQAISPPRDPAARRAAAHPQISGTCRAGAPASPGPEAPRAAPRRGSCPRRIHSGTG